MKSERLKEESKCTNQLKINLSKITISKSFFIPHKLKYLISLVYYHQLSLICLYKSLFQTWTVLMGWNDVRPMVTAKMAASDVETPVESAIKTLSI